MAIGGPQELNPLRAIDVIGGPFASAAAQSANPCTVECRGFADEELRAAASRKWCVGRFLHHLNARLGCWRDRQPRGFDGSADGDGGIDRHADVMPTSSRHNHPEQVPGAALPGCHHHPIYLGEDVHPPDRPRGGLIEHQQPAGIGIHIELQQPRLSGERPSRLKLRSEHTHARRRWSGIPGGQQSEQTLRHKRRIAGGGGSDEHPPGLRLGTGD